jgi:hypothetical protein
LETPNVLTAQKVITFLSAARMQDPEDKMVKMPVFWPEIAAWVDRCFLEFAFPNALHAKNCSSPIMAGQSSTKKLYSHKSEGKVEITEHSRKTQGSRKKLLRIVAGIASRKADFGRTTGLFGHSQGGKSTKA